MDEKEVFKRINKMLEDTDLPLKIEDWGDLTDFLNDTSNERFEAYPVIARYYDLLSGKPQIDRDKKI
jgi:hypothetical protein